MDREGLDQTTLKFAVRPHPLAPDISKATDVQLIIVHLLKEMKSQNPQLTGKVRSFVRQVGLVNLWFFLKVICGYAGPYDKLNTGLHLQLCNFRQSDWCMGDGARGAALLPRNHRKSTIMTHGGGTWDLLRNPDERLLIGSGILRRSISFKSQIQRNYDSNELMREVYTEWCPSFATAKGARRAHKWNEEEFEMPNRSRRWAEPSVTARAATGTSEGGHYSVELIDDLAGMDDLTIERQGSTTMVSKVQWFQTNTRSLLYDQITSRIVYAATQFGVDDPSQLILADCKKVFGFRDGSIKEKDDGHWAVYYRSIVENGKIIQPEAVTKEFLDDWREKDYWSYATQGANSLEASGVAEFSTYKPRFCKVYKSGERWVVDKDLALNEEGIGPKTFFLDSCDCGIYVDPAATEKGFLSKACRTAIVFWALDAEDNKYLVDLSVGQWDIYGVCDEIFQMAVKYQGYFKEVGFEEISFQRAIRTILMGERYHRKMHLNVQPCEARGDKDVRIRTLVGNPLAQGLIWLNRNCRYGEFVDEQKIFPANKYRKDILDATAMAFQRLARPLDFEEAQARDEVEEDFELAIGRNPITGY